MAEKEKKFAPVELAKITRLLLNQKRLYPNQTALAKFLGVSQSTISAMKNGRPELERQWEANWKGYLRCQELGLLNPARPSLHRDALETAHAVHDAATKIATDSIAKAPVTGGSESDKKGVSGSLQHGVDPPRRRGKKKTR